MTATTPLERTHATAIARAFLPGRWYGNRWDYYYAREKLASDPLYPGVLDALRGTDAPLLDLGCGLGLLAHALHRDGQRLAYRGVDNDAAKIARGQRAAAKAGLADARLDFLDLADALPSHRGSVAILDVLQYLPDADQQRLLEAAAAMLTSGARLVMRAALDDGDGRSRATRITDRAANLIGWMQAVPKFYPTAERVRACLENAGLTMRLSPLYGSTPFNHWLIVAERVE